MDLSDKGVVAGNCAAPYPQQSSLSSGHAEQGSSTGIDSKYPPPPLLEYNQEKSLPLLSYHGGVPPSRDYSATSNTTAFQPFRPTSLPAGSAEIGHRSSSLVESYGDTSHRLPLQEPPRSYPMPPTASISGVTASVSRLPDPYASSPARFPDSYPPPPQPEEYWNSRYMGRHNYHVPYYSDKGLKGGFPTKYEAGVPEVDGGKPAKSTAGFEGYCKEDQGRENAEPRRQSDFSSSTGGNLFINVTNN